VPTRVRLEQVPRQRSCARPPVARHWRDMAAMSEAGGSRTHSRLKDRPVVDEERSAQATSCLCNSIICMLCLAPVPMICGLALLGWNESWAVCVSRPSILPARKIQQVGCNDADAGDGSLVMLSCDLSKDALSPIAPANSVFAPGFGYVGTGLKVQAEMLQCVEHHIGGERYVYQKEWRRHHVDSLTFRNKADPQFKSNCNADNPPWPEDMPTNGATYAPRVKVGAFEIRNEFVQRVPLSAAVRPQKVPEGWFQSGDMYISSQWVNETSTNIGQVRVAFYGTDWENPMVTVAAQNDGGVLRPWKSGSSWLCTPFTVGEVRLGRASLEQLLNPVSVGISSGTMALRVAGFALVWLAVACCCCPLEAAARCGRRLGVCLGAKMVWVATCGVACPAALACTMFVVGFVWAPLRPLVAVPLLVLSVAVAAGMAVVYRLCKPAPRGKESARDLASDKP